MRYWLILLGGLTVWAAHFFLLYGIASILPGSPAAGWFVLASTVAAVAANALVLRQALPAARAAEPLDNWGAKIGVLGAALSLIAIVWQAAPALII